MKKIILSIMLLTSFSFSSGIVVCPDCEEFAKLSKVEQDKVIKKDFKILHQLFSELDGIVESINATIAEINKMRKEIKNSDGTCDALDLIKLDLNAFESKLSTIGNKNSSEYHKVKKDYHEQKKIYDTENKKYSCKK